MIGNSNVDRYVSHVVDDDGHGDTLNKVIQSLKSRHIDQQLDVPTEPLNPPRHRWHQFDFCATAKQDVETQTTDTNSMLIEVFIAALGIDDSDTAKIRTGLSEGVDQAAIIKAVAAGLHQNAPGYTEGP